MLQLLSGVSSETLRQSYCTLQLLSGVRSETLRQSQSYCTLQLISGVSSETLRQSYCMLQLLSGVSSETLRQSYCMLQLLSGVSSGITDERRWRQSKGSNRLLTDRHGAVSAACCERCSRAWRPSVYLPLLSFLVNYLRQRRRYMFLAMFVCLSVC